MKIEEMRILILLLFDAVLLFLCWRARSTFFLLLFLFFISFSFSSRFFYSSSYSSSSFPFFLFHFPFYSSLSTLIFPTIFDLPYLIAHNMMDFEVMNNAASIRRKSLISEYQKNSSSNNLLKNISSPTLVSLDSDSKGKLKNFNQFNFSSLFWYYWSRFIESQH